MRPPTVASTPTTSTVYSTPFITAAHTLDAPTDLSSANDVTPPDATFHDLSFFGSLHHEDPAPGACFNW